MADIYDILIQGIKSEEGLSEDGVAARLQQLQPSVRALRNAYRNYPVYVPYENKDIQAAYLIAYFPHYYQLIYKILLEDFPDAFKDQKSIKLAYFGGGPGPEIYGTIRFIVNNRPQVDNVEILLFDINALQWKYSHQILQNYLLPSILNSSLKVQFNITHCDLTKPFTLNHDGFSFDGCDLVVFQNCLNEIPVASITQLRKNIQSIYDLLPEKGALLFSDLTGGTRAVTILMQNIEQQLNLSDDLQILHSILQYSDSETIQSVHHTPSSVIRENLLTYQDGLIPRKWLKYNYSFLKKRASAAPLATNIIESGLQAIYTPLGFANSDANNFLNCKSFVGIDFGTSTTVVSLAQVKDAKIVTETVPVTQKNENGFCDFRPLIHSAIALKNSRLLFGCYAYELKSELVKNVNIWHSFKMELGAANNVMYPESQLHDNPFYPLKNTHDAITHYFSYLREQIAYYILDSGYPPDIEYAVSIPASFLESERMDLLICLEDAGIVVGNNPFIDEPIAAVLNYLAESNDPAFLSEPKTIMVIDCGAGTCDVSILEVGIKTTGAYSKNLSISRFGKIGGKFLDRMIAEEVLWKQLAAQHCTILSCSNKEKELILDSLTEIGEKLKIKLCKSIDVHAYNNYKLPEHAVSSDVNCILDEYITLNDGPQLLFNKPSITYGQFLSVMNHYTSFSGSVISPVNTLNYSIQSALGKSGLAGPDMDCILLTGGGSRNPYLVSSIAGFFCKSRVIIPDNIQEHVAKGAAIHSLALNTFGVNLIKPILSDDLFIRNHKGSIMLFPAGTEIPSNDRRFEVSPFLPGQACIEIPVFSSSAEAPLKVISFHSKPSSKYHLHFFINPEKWLECDVMENGSEIKVQVDFPPGINTAFSFIIVDDNY